MLPTKCSFIWRFQNRTSLVTHRNEISNLHAGHSIDAFYQVAVHLAMQFKRRIFLEICDYTYVFLYAVPVSASLTCICLIQLDYLIIRRNYSHHLNNKNQDT